MSGCPKCGCEEVEIFDESLDSEIDLDNNKIYVKQAVTCSNCGREYGRTVTADIVNIKVETW